MADEAMAIVYVGPEESVGPVDSSIVNEDGEPVVVLHRGRIVYAAPEIASALVDHGFWSVADAGVIHQEADDHVLAAEKQVELIRAQAQLLLDQADQVVAAAEARASTMRGVAESLPTTITA